MSGRRRGQASGLRVIRAVYRADGLLGFYRGFLGSLLMYIPSSMIFWLVYYDTLIRSKRLYARLLSEGRSDDFAALPARQQNLLALQASAGVCAGLATACVTNPLEVLRIRIQVSAQFGNAKVGWVWRFCLFCFMKMLRCTGPATGTRCGGWPCTRARGCSRRAWRRAWSTTPSTPA